MLNFNQALERVGQEDEMVIKFAEKCGAVTSREQVFGKLFSAFEGQMVDEQSTKEVAMFIGKVSTYLGFPKA